VAFTAPITNSITNVAVNQVIVFDRVVTNIGNAYNNHGGIFTAPVSGAYEFAVTIMSEPGHVMHADILKDGTDELCHMYASSAEYDTSTCVVMVHLIAGNDVWIRHNIPWSESNEGIKGSHFSAFSGHLIQAD
jgi:hypothetical protein